MSVFRPLFFTALLGTLLLTSLPARAQHAPSSNQDVYFAFFKTGGKTPDFTRALRDSPAYRKIPPVRQKAFLTEEKQRLIAAFQAFDPQVDLLTVQTPVLVQLGQIPREGDDPLFTLSLSFKQGDATFFPFEYEAYKIAVLPQQLPALMKQQIIPVAQFDLIRTLFMGSTEGTATLFIDMKPTRSYMNQPYDIDGMEQWALITDIAGLNLVSRRGAPLWSYSAPWYVSPMTEQLDTIYSDETQRKEQEMRSENPIAPGQ